MFPFLAFFISSLWFVRCDISRFLYGEAVNEGMKLKERDSSYFYVLFMNHPVVFLVDVCTLARILGFGFLICDVQLLLVRVIYLKRKYLE